jgi:hypothetical protein
VPLDPAGPRGLELRGCQRVQLGGQGSGEFGEDRPDFGEADQAGRSNGAGRARGEEDQDTDSGKADVNDGPILGNNRRP